jgi:molecular chaperone GrpE
LLEGIKMVAQALQATLARYNCQKIDALGKPFDPAVHEAISQQPKPDVPPGTVLNVVQDGYTLHDRVVRPAQVIVSAAPA